MNFGKFIYKVNNEKKCIVEYHFFGICIKKINILYLLSQIEKINKYNKEKIIQGVQRSICTANIHRETFLKFKNINQGKEVVLVGAGPSLKDFVPFVEEKIYVGCNRAFLYKQIKFDYLFTIDKAGLVNENENYYKDFFSYRNEKCIKFVGDQNRDYNFQIPESEILKYHVNRYKTTSGYLPDNFNLDLETYPLANTASVSLQALQFILYTNPSKIYLVGIDCTGGTGKHFTGFDTNLAYRGTNTLENDKYNIICFKKIKNFAKIYYPDTEIISINPVGLKGIFTDIYR